MSKIAMKCRLIRSNSISDDSDSSSDDSSCNFRGFRVHTDDEDGIAFDSSRDNCKIYDSPSSKRCRDFCYHSRYEVPCSFWESEDSSPTPINSEQDFTPKICNGIQARLRCRNANDIPSSKSNQRPTREELDYLSFPLFTVCIAHSYKNEDKNKGNDDEEDFQRRDSITTLTSCSFEDSSDDDSLHSFCTSASESEDDSDEEILNIPLPSIQIEFSTHISLNGKNIIEKNLQNKSQPDRQRVVSINNSPLKRLTKHNEENDDDRL